MPVAARTAARSSALFFVLATLGASTAAHAAGAAGCADAFDQSQVKRDAGKLLDARQLLLVCQARNCSRTQQKLCSEWLVDVKQRIPSLVLSAKDGAGGDIVAVNVAMDGVPIATKLDGLPIEVDPGPHSFVFELADGTKAERTVIADERSQGKLVSVVLQKPPAASQSASAPDATNATSSEPGSRDPTSRTGGSPLKTVGLVVGAAGVAALAVGTVFGIEALSTKGSHCESGLCDAGSASTAYKQATISTFGFVAGGVLLTGGVTMFLLTPKDPGERPAASATLAPTVGPSGGGLQLSGRW
jgi:hypothetical protein